MQLKKNKKKLLSHYNVKQRKNTFALNRNRDISILKGILIDEIGCGN